MTAARGASDARSRRDTAAYEGESAIVGRGSDQPVLERIPALDGIRAIAILLVLVHNAGSVAGPSTGAPLAIWSVISNAGWFGVQLFFALSGFLITRILLGSKHGEGWARSFYARRVLRIVPLYFVLLTLVFFVAPHIAALHAIAGQPARSTMWYWAYLSNWVSPFGGTAPALPHVWSLAVEEQFYLVWPLVVALVSDGVLASVCVLLFAGALGARLVLHAVYPADIANAAAYTWTITRCDAIALGALVAVALRHARVISFLRRWTFAGLAIAVAALGLATVIGRGMSPLGPLSEYVGQPLSGVLAALLVAVCVVPGAASGAGRAVVRGLEFRPLPIIGKYSYAIYVFHMPVHFLLRGAAANWLTEGTGTERFLAHAVYTLVVFAGSMGLALVSWRVIEQPALSLKRYFPMRRPLREAQ